MRIFVIGCMERLELSGLGWLETGCAEVSGVFTTCEEANRAVIENWAVLDDYCYNYAVVQESRPNQIYPDVLHEWWYQWDSQEEAWHTIPRPSVIPENAPYRVIA